MLLNACLVFFNECLVCLICDFFLLFQLLMPALRQYWTLSCLICGFGNEKEHIYVHTHTHFVVSVTEIFSEIFNRGKFIRNLDRFFFSLCKGVVLLPNGSDNCREKNWL